MGGFRGSWSVEILLNIGARVVPEGPKNYRGCTDFRSRRPWKSSVHRFRSKRRRQNASSGKSRPKSDKSPHKWYKSDTTITAVIARRRRSRAWSRRRARLPTGPPKLRNTLHRARESEEVHRVQRTRATFPTSPARQCPRRPRRPA